jgi:hypothetical protein
LAGKEVGKDEVMTALATPRILIIGPDQLTVVNTPPVNLELTESSLRKEYAA